MQISKKIQTILAGLLLSTIILIVTGCGSSSPATSSGGTGGGTGGAGFILLGGTMQTGTILNPVGTATILAGSTSVGAADGTGTAAQFNWPFGITSDGSNLYVADTRNHTIRKIVIATGATTTLAGTNGVGGNTDGTGTAATFNGPRGITTDGTNLYVAENSDIRKIVIATGVVTTIAGSTAAGYLDGTGTVAQFNGPAGITTDGTNLYVSETGNTIRKIVISTGIVTTVAGSTAASFANGTGTAAGFVNPMGITTDGTNLYVADSNAQTIRKIVIATGVVTTLAGTGGIWGNADGTGAAARFGRPIGIVTDGTNLYVSDEGNGNIRKIVIATGVVTTVATGFVSTDGITTNGSALFATNVNNGVWSNIQKIQ